jgi:uncharacterized protein (DUF849 family)
MCTLDWCQDGRVVDRLTVCLNGGRTRRAYPTIPVTPAELAEAAVRAVEAGADAIHLHPRDTNGDESLEARDVGAAVAAVRRACGAVPIGVSTGLWIAYDDPVARYAAVAGWADLSGPARPDSASVNVSEPGFADLVELLRGNGIAAEPGVWSVEDADALARIPSVDGWSRVLVEVLDGPPTETADEVLHRLDWHGITGPRLLHGEEATCWPLVAYAGWLDLPTRIGLEDTTVGPDGEAVPDNAALVRLALAIWTSHRAGERPYGQAESDEDDERGGTG